jgi:hypothetical protein
MRRLLDLWRRRLAGRGPRSRVRQTWREPGNHRRARKSPALHTATRSSGRSRQPFADSGLGSMRPVGQQPHCGVSPGVPDLPQGLRPGPWLPKPPPPGGIAAAPGSAPVAAAARARTQIKAGPQPNAAATAGRARRASQATAVASAKAAVPWYERAQRGNSAPGQRHCGLLEKILHRQWAADQLPPPQIVLAVDRLAEFPQLIKERLVTGLDAIYVGPGGVPDLDDMGSLGGTPLPSGRATWDVCAGAYGERKVIVGSRPSPTPDVMCHEIGHALDDIDGADGTWLSDSTEFARLYAHCTPWMTNDFHRQPGHLGRREFFADAFAAIASSQRPALLEMLGGNTRVALKVMLYFNVLYGI